MRTQVGIVGWAGGPYSHLLHLEGIESVVLERRSREDLETTVRPACSNTARPNCSRVGVGERMERRFRPPRDRTALRRTRAPHRLRRPDGRAFDHHLRQQEVVKDLIRARLEADGKILFEARAESVEDLDTDSPKIRFLQNGQQEEISCDYVAGCDGSFGVCRSGIPRTRARSTPEPIPLGGSASSSRDRHRRRS